MTPRAMRERLLAGFLVCSIVLIVTLPADGQKKHSNPDEIGHRSVAHQSNISIEKERAIGKSSAMELDRSAELVQNPTVEQYVTSVAGIVVSHSDLKGPVAVKVIKSSEVNGSSLPGGFIYLSSALLLAAKNDDEIAAVIAHQVAHAAARHWASDLTKRTILEFSMDPLNSTPVAPPVHGATIEAVCAGYIYHRSVSMVPEAFLKVQRQNELEADYLGLQYVYEAGYDPSAYVTWLARIAPQIALSQIQHDSLRATPAVPVRIAQAEEEIRKILPNAPKPRTSPEFALMKSHL
jgi:predicted Zn-dependent protease